MIYIRAYVVAIPLAIFQLTKTHLVVHKNNVPVLFGT